MSTKPIRTGCVLKMENHYYKGDLHDGSAIMEVEVLRHHYGLDNGHHNFRCKVLKVIESNSPQTHSKGDKFNIKGCNLYPHVLLHKQGKESVDTEKRGWE